MKILMTIFSIQDYGGIVPHVEHLAAGLRECGHSVDFVILLHQTGWARKSSVTGDDFFTLGTGYPFSVSKGWREVPKYCYFEESERQKFKDFCSNFDAVLWHIPVPTMNTATQGHMEWEDIYAPAITHIAIIHDGNLPKLYPHILKVRGHFKALVCVHPSAYNSSAETGMLRRLIVNPFDVQGWDTVKRPGFAARKGLVAVQVFKAWKRVDTLIRALPHLQQKDGVYVGGDGIERRYMTSEEKTKLQYFNPVTGDRIWDEAVAAGMQWKGYIPNDDVYELLLNARIQVDPSWSRRYAKYGSHFNRTTVEAMLCGAVPVATDLGMYENPFWKAGKNYVSAPFDATPTEFAGILDDAMTNKKQWTAITEANREEVKRFDRRTVAQQYVDLITERTPLHAKPSADLEQKSKAALEFFKGELE